MGKRSILKLISQLCKLIVDKILKILNFFLNLFIKKNYFELSFDTSFDCCLRYLSSNYFLRKVEKNCFQRINSSLKIVFCVFTQYYGLGDAACENMTKCVRPNQRQIVITVFRNTFAGFSQANYWLRLTMGCLPPVKQLNFANRK